MGWDKTNGHVLSHSSSTSVKKMSESVESDVDRVELFRLTLRFFDDVS